MSALDHSVSAPAEVGSSRTVGGPLPFRAAVYLAVVGGATVALALPLLRGLSFDTPGWTTFILLTLGAGVAQLFTVRTQRNYSYHMTGVFLVPAILLLPVPLVALIPVAQRIPDWLRRKGPWTIQSFNVFAYTLAVLAAWGGVHLVDLLVPNGKAGLALAGVVAALLFVGVQAALAAPMLCLARGCSVRETGVFTFQGISTELVLAALGVGVAFLWVANPWLVPFALAPLLIVHRSLSVPLLQAEARVDPKTGLFNPRHFTATLENEFARAQRFDRPLALVMADLDLLREVNNRYGHLAGDAVLRAVADVFRAQLRHYDVPARFGGEEFAIILPETGPEEALEIAERIRSAVSEQRVPVETSQELVSITVSVGVAAYPSDGGDATELVHQADMAVYRAKLQGRNRVVRSGADAVAVTAPVPDSRPRQLAPQAKPAARSSGQPRLSARNLWLAGALGGAAGIAGLLLGREQDLVGMLAVVGIVALVQALADGTAERTASVNAVGVLAGAALFGPRVALPVALAACCVEWARTRNPRSRLAFDTGMMTLAALAAAGTFALRPAQLDHELATILAGLAAGVVYFAVQILLPAVLAALAAPGPRRRALPSGTGWPLLHHLAAGLLAGIVAVAFGAAGMWTLALLVVPLLLARSSQERHVAEAQRLAASLVQTTEQARARSASLERANRTLREHAMSVMEALAGRVDAREAAGHSREVQRLALAIGRQLRLSQAELEVLGHAALFHDIGKLAVPDAVVQKPDPLTEEEWALMRPHAAEGARIVEQLAFLGDAVPAIRHHHEHFDGSGYPDGLRATEIPLGARIIHVADAVVSMLHDRRYEPRRTPSQVLAEVRRCSGTQFCPRCVDALEAVAAAGPLPGLRRPVAASAR